MNIIPFDAKLRPEIEAGNLSVVTEDHRPVEILRWDMEGLYPILGIVMMNPSDNVPHTEERPFAFDSQGHPADYCQGDKLSLSLVSYKDNDDSKWCNVSEFDQRLNVLLKKFEAIGKDEIASVLAFYLGAVKGESEEVRTLISLASSEKPVIQNLWHDAAEEPEAGRELITRSEKGIKVYPNPKNNRMAWAFFTKISRITSWFYSDELLPKVYKDKTI